MLMIEFYKKKGETPLQALNRLRSEQPELADETLSYAGRLDPMAEGILTILVGKEENQNRKEFLERDKEYEAHFLIGVSTDTNDILGVIEDSDFKHIDEKKIRDTIESLTSVTEQTYPWYSSKTVQGIPLFEYARLKNFDIERPKRSVKIYSVSDIIFHEIKIEELIEQNIKDIESVVGDFRQGEVIGGWDDLVRVRAGQAKPAQLVSCTLSVSSGTYIRTLAEYMGKVLKTPVLLQKLVRTKVF